MLSYLLFLQKLNVFFLLKTLPRCILTVHFKMSEIHIEIKPDSLLFCLAFLKKCSFLQFTCLNDLVVVDNVIQSNRFFLHYLLFSLKYNARIFLSVHIKPFFFLPSAENLFAGSAWLEREAWDLFGIFFYNNSNLRRILTDYGFKGHPLRKNFPLTGFFEIYYSDIDRRIKQVPVQVTEDRHRIKFNFFWK